MFRSPQKAYIKGFKTNSKLLSFFCQLNNLSKLIVKDKTYKFAFITISLRHITLSFTLTLP